MDSPILPLTKLCMDLSEAADMPALFDKCVDLQELIIRKGNVTNITDECLKQIGNIGFNISTLVSLSIRNIILPSSVKRQINQFSQILHLEIIAGGLTDRDVANIGVSLPGLLELGLCGNSVTSHGIRQLARNLWGLRALDIMATLADASEEVCTFLTEEWVFPSLNVLYVRLWAPEWREKLIAAKPKCKIIDFNEWKRTMS